jgi:hypothetical protein
MTTYKVVVDGSNVATEGRTSPSLNQLDEAVRSFIEEHPGADVLVVVDTSFPNKIDSSELPIYEAAYAANEIITPPAGTIGRGDAFILKIADKLDAVVFSNDSFQEFHGTYDWLFDKGRLIGGKPIPGLGWVFTARSPVRGVKSREAVREAKRTMARIGSPEAMRPMPVPKAPPTFMTKPAASDDTEDGSGGSGGKRRRGRKVRPEGRSDSRSEGRADTSSAETRERQPREPRVRVEVTVSSNGEDADRDRKRKKRRRKGGKGTSASEGRSVEAVNEPLPFLGFVSEHPIGATVSGVIESYSSHGFYVEVSGARCYVPLSGIAVPQPRAAKEVVRKGDTMEFVVRAFDPSRRGIEIALPGTPAALDLREGGDLGDVGDQSGAQKAKRSKSSKDTKGEKSPKEAKAAKADRPTKAAKADKAVKSPASGAAKATAEPKKAAATKTPTKGTAKKAAGGKEAVVAKEAVAKKAVAKKAVVKKAASKAVAAPAVEPVKKAAAKKTVAKKAVAKTGAAKAPVKKAPAKKAPVKKAAPAPKAVAKKAAPTKAAPAPKTAVKKAAPAPKASAKKASPAKASPAKATLAKKAK